MKTKTKSIALFGGALFASGAVATGASAASFDLQGAADGLPNPSHSLSVFIIDPDSSTGSYFVGSYFDSGAGIDPPGGEVVATHAGATSRLFFGASSFGYETSTVNATEADIRAQAGGFSGDRFTFTVDMDVTATITWDTRGDTDSVWGSEIFFSRNVVNVAADEFVDYSENGGRGSSFGTLDVDLVTGELYQLSARIGSSGGAASESFVTVSIPEPGSLALLGLGGLAMLRRRRG